MNGLEGKFDCRICNFSLKFENELLEKLYEVNQYALAKSKCLTVGIYYLIFLLWYTIMGIYYYFQEIEKEKHLWAIKFFSSSALLVLIELFHSRYRHTRWLHGILLIMLPYIGMVEFSLMFYNSVLLTPM